MLIYWLFVDWCFFWVENCLIVLVNICMYLLLLMNSIILFRFVCVVLSMCIIVWLLIWYVRLLLIVWKVCCWLMLWCFSNIKNWWILFILCYLVLMMVLLIVDFVLGCLLRCFNFNWGLLVMWYFVINVCQVVWFVFLV